MKRGLILLLLAIAPLFLAAQTENVAPKPSWGKFITNGFWDNWFLSVGAGGKIHFGSSDKQGDFSDRIAPSFDFAVGKWIVPTLGLRLHANGIHAKGFTSNPNNIFTDGTTANSKGVYPQKWKQAQAQVDVLINASNWIGGYRPDRFFEFVPFAGGGVLLYSGERKAMAITAGLLNKMRLTEAIDLNLELRGDIFDSKYYQDTDGKRAALTTVLGVAYNFNRRTFARSNDDKLREEIAALLAATDKLKDSRNKLTQENSALQDELKRAQAEKTALQQQLENQSTNSPVIQTQLVFFKIGNSVVSKADKDRLKKWADIIKTMPNKRFIITGYADKATGSPQRNLVLSKERAENVFKILTKEFGVNADQFKVEYKGGVIPRDLPTLHCQRVTIIAE
ncbi:MAG: OmpA family protein [Odoribacteraceae bacterium]|jgi:outer membrane protein OmpA-like peptidoglycan-associated protein|nr:OmpA family protein [Odoribacteraceae bacterium]